jgi:hypothetical protein
MKRKQAARIFAFTAIMLSAMTMIGWIFWKQELQYALPTPVPTNFVDVKMGEKVDLTAELGLNTDRPAFLHFFNFDCSCSRFNMQDFERMAHRYKDSINFYVVIQSDDEDAVDHFNRKYGLSVEAIRDKNGIISDKCGIYATPQAVIIDKNSTIFFKGNYNAARFCTRKETRFAEMALGHLLKNEQLPMSLVVAITEPYGCSLPSDEPLAQSDNNTFKLF